MAAAEGGGAADGAADADTGDGGGEAEVETTPEGATEGETGQTGEENGEVAPEPGAEGETIPEGDASAEGNTDADDEAIVDEFAKEHGIPEKDKAGRVNRIPYPRVKKITDNAVRKIVKALTGKDVPADRSVGDIVNEHTTQFRSITSEIDNMKKGEWVMIHAPERFLELLPQVNPKYAELLAARVEAAKETPVADDMPEPDYDLGEGKGRTYSQNGIKSLVAWIRSDVKRELMAEQKKALKPYEDERAVSQRIESAAQSLQRTVNEARQNWTGFKDWEKDIDAALKADTAGALTLWTAYLKVRDAKHNEALSKATTDEKALRAKILKEMNAKPSSSSAAARSTSPKAEDNTPKTMDDVVRNALKQKGLIK